VPPKPTPGAAYIVSTMSSIVPTSAPSMFGTSGSDLLQ